MTTGLVPGPNVGDIESKNADVSEGVGVIDGTGDDVEESSELGELLS